MGNKWIHLCGHELKCGAFGSEDDSSLKTSNGPPFFKLDLYKTKERKHCDQQLYKIISKPLLGGACTIGIF